MPRPQELWVVSDESHVGFFLLYLDSNGQAITDTFHLSLDAAFEQAQFEFGVQRSEWTLEPIPF